MLIKELVKQKPSSVIKTKEELLKWITSGFNKWKVARTVDRFKGTVLIEMLEDKHFNYQKFESFLLDETVTLVAVNPETSVIEEAISINAYKGEDYSAEIDQIFSYYDGPYLDTNSISIIGTIHNSSEGFEERRDTIISLIEVPKSNIYVYSGIDVISELKDLYDKSDNKNFIPLRGKIKNVGDLTNILLSTTPQDYTINVKIGCEDEEDIGREIDAISINSVNKTVTIWGGYFN